MKGTIEIDQEFCKGCRICVAFCPQGAIAPSDHLNASGYQPVRLVGECNGCATCAMVCPEAAIEVYRG